MPEFYEFVHAHVRDGIEEEMIARPALEATIRQRLPGLLEGVARPGCLRPSTGRPWAHVRVRAFGV